jgi:pyruvate dehydrogenase (quinone)
MRRAPTALFMSVVQAVLKGDPDALHLAVQGAKTKLREMLPGRRP